MKQSTLLLQLSFSCFLLLGSAGTSLAADKPFLAGAAAVDVTPTEFPVIVNGMFEQRTADGAVDRLMSRALVLDDGNTRLAIVVVDNLMIPRELLDEAKSIASRASGIPVERMLVSATHTHSAPAAMGCLGSDADPAYVAFLPSQIAKSISLAAKNLVPARIGWTVVKDEAHSHCRRWIFRPDRIGRDPFGQQNVRANMHPGHQSANHIGPSGPADPDLSLLAVENADGTPLAVVANYAMHYYGSGLVSGDFCGRFGGRLGELIDANASTFVGMMSQGTSGDGMWMDYGMPSPRRDLEEYTEAVAKRAADAYRTIEFHDWVPLAMEEAKLKLTRRVPDAERLEWARETYPLPLETPSTGSLGRPKVYAREALLLDAEPDVEIKLQAIRIGDLGMTALPNEVYAITGLKVKAQSPLAMTFNIELANGAQGYIPPPEQHALGGYTTWPARTAGLEVGAEPKIVETLLSLLEKVSGEKREPIVDSDNDYAKAIMASKPLAYWRLADMVPDQAIDTTGKHHAKLRGGVAMYLPGPQAEGISSGWRGNRAVHLAGGQLDASLEDLAVTSTVSLWFWTGLPHDARPVAGVLIARGEGEQSESLVIGGNSNPESTGNLVFRVGDQSFVGSARLATHRWHNVVLSRTPTAVTVYLDGNPKPDLVANVDRQNASPHLSIGGNQTDDQSFEGKIDEVAVFNRALTTDEIVNHYAISRMKPPPQKQPKRIIETKPSDESSRRAYHDAIKASQPVAFWRLSDGNGTEITDFVGEHHGKYSGNAKPYQPGSNDKNFQGGRAAFEVPKVGNSYSVELWFRNELAHHARAVTGYIFSHGDDGSKDAIGDHLGIGGTHSAAGRLIVFNGNRRNQLLSGATQLVPGSWNHVVFVRNGPKVRVYLNGSTNPDIEGDLPLTYPTECRHWFLGGRNDNFANFQGCIDEFALYDRTLQPKEIADHFAASGAQITLAKAAKPIEDPQALPLEQSVKQIKIREGYRLELVVAEPMVKDPVAIDWGADGKLWVVEMADYPLGMDGEGEPGGRVRYLEDTNDDGRYDTSTLFAEGLPFPTGVLAWQGGILVTAAPEIIYLEDTTGDGKADKRQTLFSGFLEGNQQLRVNGLRYGLDNWVHCASGSHHAGYGKENRIKSHLTGENFRIGSRDFRIRPADGRIDPQSGPSQYGRNRDDWGNWFGVQNSRPLWHYVLADHYIRRNPHFAPPDPRWQVVTPLNPKVFPAKQPQKRFHGFDQSGRFTSACSGMVYRDELLFPRDDRQHAFTCEPFHNLVQHNVLHSDGVSFRATRDPAEAKLDFFASADRWCRPVMTRTGPDGALWVVDMYRYMIEHPQWLPQAGKDELRPYYRYGDDLGRVYRIVPQGRSLRKIPRLIEYSNDQLVDALQSPGGWIRDTAQRLLIDRKADDAIGPLHKMLRESKQPLARLHALCTLDGLDALTPAVLQAAIEDTHPAIRRHAIRLSEQCPIEISRLVKRTSDPDPQVRLQLACSLGYYDQPLAGDALAELALAAPDEPYLIAAVTSSMNRSNLPQLLSAIVQKQEAPPDELVDLVFSQIAAFGDADTVASAVTLASSMRGTQYQAWQLSSLAKLLSGLTRRGGKLSDHVSASQIVQVDQLIQRACAIAADSSVDESVRVAAVALMFRDTGKVESDLKLVGDLLVPQTPLAVQQAVVARSAAAPATNIAETLLANWSAHSPQLRSEILSVVASRKAWVESLLERLENGDVTAAAIDAPMRERLLATKDGHIKARLHKVFADATTESRQQVLDRYKTALTLDGEIKRGEAVFAKRCISCHRYREVGHEVGPNLASLTSKTPAAILVSILDPSSAVETKFLNYVAITDDGRSLAGVVVTETGSSVTLLTAEGKRKSLLREEIEELKSTGKSIMPDGLEKDLSPQDLADLIAFVRTMSANGKE